MSATNSPYNSLINKLDKFIRKYYTNQLIRGAIFSAVYVLAFFLAINLLEYYFYLSTGMRKVLFFGFLLSSVAFVANFFIVPLLHYYRLGKVISYEQAAQIIGTHFTEVKDKLLNILQLRQAAEGQSGTSLLLAAIDQKSVELKPIDFSFAVDLSKNKKYLKYLAPPVLLFLFIIIAAPNVIKEGTKRLYHNDTFYEKEAPFKFAIQNKSLTALQFENFTLQVKIEGDVLPNEVFVETGGNTLKLKKQDKDLFTYEFVNLQKTTPFQFAANGFRSKEYVIDVVAKPVVAGFEVACDYPAYTGKQDEVLKNMGDLVIPAGTKLSWRFNTQNVEAITFAMGDSTYSVKRTGESEFAFSKAFMQSAQYTLKVSNSNIKDADSVSYSLNVTPDLYPVIAVKEKNDSATQKYFYYIGEISDDYGLRRLTFNYQLTRADSTTSVNKAVDVPFTSGLASRFTFYWQLADFGIKPGDKITYYFEVWDNDGMHGSKSTKSELMNYNMPSLSELNREITKDNKELKQELKDAMKKAADAKEQLQAMKDKLQEKQNLNWEDKKNLDQSVEKQKELQQQLEEIKKKMEENFEKQKDFKEVSPEVAEKQEHLQQLMEEVMNKEMKEMMEKLKKMLDEMQKRDALEKMDDMQQNSEKMEKELDRMLELFKKMEFDQKLQETADKLEKLAQKQEELAKKTEENQQQLNKENKDGKENKENTEAQAKQEELKKEQDKLNQELKDAKKDMEDLKKLNEETKSDQDFKDVENSMQTAEKQQQDAKQNMDQKQNQKAGQNQKNAANNMKDAAQKLSDMKMAMEAEENAEDMQAVRQLLENIVQLSFDEEKLMNALKSTNINSPKYIELMKEQQRIKENSKMVEDTLYAVARRQESIKSFITKEITNINKYLGKSIADMEDRNVIRAMSNQQFTMTGYNNLALMLSEALQQMQQQQSEQQQQQSDGKPKMCMKCKKPGMGLPNLSKMQKQLKDKMQQMGEMMKREGKGEKGQTGRNSQQSKEFAEMAQMQSQIRRELEKINQQENKDGKNPLGNLGEAIKQMEQTEKELVNKQLTAEALKCQQDILNKLLEAENAQRERDQKQERESNTGKDQERKMPPSLEEYLKARNSEVDLYRTVPPSLKPYYKGLAEKYFRNITITQ
ncbi:MAG TPA: DUF4175 family protein [Chitinophagales bacterium]|nr:DUF4175 family protein [Chitinophagales bacterium]